MIGRDIKQSDFGGIVRVLSNWCDTCDTMLSCIETQADISAVFITRDVPNAMLSRLSGFIYGLYYLRYPVLNQIRYQFILPNI